MRSKAMKILLITVMLVMAVCAISSCFDARCAHEYGEWEVITEATCISDGISERYCVKCGETESQTTTGEHDYGSTYTYKGADGHAVKCRTCGARGSVQAHVGGAEATEDNDQICVICNYVMVEKLTHVCEWSGAYGGDGDGHWQLCECGEIVGGEAEHEFVNDCTGECYVCEQSVRTPAAHGGRYPCSSSCDECGETLTPMAHEGSLPCANRCKWCGTVITPEDHQYSSDCDTTCNICGTPRVTTEEHKPLRPCKSGCELCNESTTPVDCEGEYVCSELCKYCDLPLENVNEHTYDNACDAYCNICGKDRTSSAHVYDNACDAYCNSCGEDRNPASHVYDNACDSNCNVCLATREVADHVYYNACDASCNVCSATREVDPHAYTNACDADCNECGEVRTPASHAYTNACDADCNVCGAVREPAAHVYDNACDAVCNVCSLGREVGAHEYVNACDKDCNECGAVRVPADHKYDNACDASCNVCFAAREVDPHAYTNACDADCNECGELRTPASHAYTNACDADCNVCGAVREPAAHVYDNACDAVCNECEDVRVPTDHQYDGACDTTCSVCGGERAVDHVGTARIDKYDDTHHWTECSCGFVFEDTKAAHTINSVVTEPTCTEAGYTTCACDVCEYIKVDSATEPAPHPFKDGYCTECGAESDACDHVADIEVTRDLSEYGSCTETITYMSCECGKTKEFTEEQLMPLISGRGFGDCEIQFNNSGGVSSGRCYTCDLLVELIEIQENVGCVDHTKFTIILILGTTTLMFTYGTESDGHDIGYAVKEFDEDESACGGYLIMNVCTECGEMNSMIDFISRCEDIKTVTEEKMGDDGYMHTVTTRSCEACDLIFVVDVYKTKMTCGFDTVTKEYLYLGEDIVAESAEEVVREGNYCNYEVDVALAADTCEGGLVYVYTCVDCGDVITEPYDGEHFFVEAEAPVENMCAKHVYYEKCRFCDEFRMQYVLDSFDDYEYEYGGIGVSSCVYFCSDCELKYTKSSYEYIKDECHVVERETRTLMLGEEIIFEKTSERMFDYAHGDSEMQEIIYYLIGDRCEEGGLIIARCNKCHDYLILGHIEPEHKIAEKVYKGEELGVCSDIRVQYCEICGAVVGAGYENGECEPEIIGEPETVVNGNETHVFMTQKCKRCDLVNMLERVVIENGEETISYDIIHVLVGDEELFCIYHNYSVETHSCNYEGMRYILRGESCEEGGYYVKFCTECDKIHEITYFNEHGYNYDSLELSETFGVCDNSYLIFCDTCGKNVNQYITCIFEYDAEASGEDVTVYKCQSCGLTKTIITEEVVDGCVTYVSTFTRLQMESTLIFSGIGDSNRTYNHSAPYFGDESLSVYFNNGMDCFDGGYFEYVCAKCRETVKIEFYGCYDIADNHLLRIIDLTEYGAPYGEVYVHECFCGNQKRYENMFGDSMFADESEELGSLTCHTDTESGYTIAFGIETEEQDESSSVVREYLYVDYDVETNEYSERILLYEYNIEL